MHTNRKHASGFTLVEMLGALAVGAVLVAGLVSLIDSSLEDSKAQQAGLHQSQVVAAASKYINANYAALLASATAASPAVIDIAALKSTKYLSANFSMENAYGQTPCVLVLQPSPGKLDALVVTEKGVPIPSKNTPYVASNAGQGGGYIPADAPATARGAFNSWSAPLAAFASKNCTGTPAGPDHLASALFFDGPGNLSTDYMYRGSVPGHPELNEMNTPLNMKAQATENTSDALCVAGDVYTYGRIAVNASGAVLSCQNGIWMRQGSAFWKDPVADFGSLPASGNNKGDVRMVTGLSRAFTWNGSAWAALAVDQDGNLTVPNTVAANNVLLNQVVTKNAACSQNGLLARDATGLLLTCQSGRWRSLLETRITTRAFDQSYTFVPSNGIQNFRISIASILGSRPLYITGYAYCNTNGGLRTWAVAEVYDAADNLLGYNGGCGAASEPGGLVLNKGVIGLQKIPENATSIRVYVEPGSLPQDYGFIRLVVFNSE